MKVKGVFMMDADAQLCCDTSHKQFFLRFLANERAYEMDQFKNIELKSAYRICKLL